MGMKPSPLEFDYAFVSYRHFGYKLFSPVSRYLWNYLPSVGLEVTMDYICLLSSLVLRSMLESSVSGWLISIALQLNSLFLRTRILEILINDTKDTKTFNTVV